MKVEVIIRQQRKGRETRRMRTMDFKEKEEGGRSRLQQV